MSFSDTQLRAALAAAGAVSCTGFLYAVSNLQSRINAAAKANGFKGDVKELDVPDKLFGYTPDKLWQVFSNYGPEGRALFKKVEVLDVAWFFPSYAAFFGVVWQDVGVKLQQQTGCRDTWAKAPVLLVGALVLLDAAENAGHLALLRKFNEAKGVKPQDWDEAAAAASRVNQAKWWVGRAVLAGPVLWLLLAARQVLKQR